MRIDGKHVHIHRNGEVVGHLVVALARWNIDLARPQGNFGRAPCGLLLRKVQRHAGAVGLGPAGGVVVDLEHQVGSAMQQIGNSIGLAGRFGPRRPSAQAARRQETRSSETGIP